jgi:hypothetical protein
MNPDIVPLQRVKLSFVLQDSPLPDLARAIRQSALAKALRGRRAYTGDEALLELDLRRPAVLESVKDGLAQGVASALAFHEPQVKAVYAYDPSANPDNETGEDRPFDPVLHLLVLVAAASPALPAFVAELDQALVEILRDVPSLAFQMQESILDVMLLTDEDIQQRIGYGALLSSVFAPAIEIWRR